MTRPLYPDIKAMRAIDRALTPLDAKARRALIDWLYAREYDTTQDEVAARFRLWPILKRDAS